MKTKIVKLKTTKRNMDIIMGIVARYKMLVKSDKREDTRIIMDLIATHENGCKLNLMQLKNAKLFDLNHDLAGIRDNLNRTAGKLQNNFVPRYAKQ